MSYNYALWYAIGIILTTFIMAIIGSHFVVVGYHIGMKVRVAVCSLIYRKVNWIEYSIVPYKTDKIYLVFDRWTKALKLSQTALGETAPGKVVNLLSNDVNRFDRVSMFLNSMWSAPLLTICIAILLWRDTGSVGMMGIIIVFIAVPIQSKFIFSLTTNNWRHTSTIVFLSLF